MKQMKKKDYAKPSMKVYELKRHPQLLQMSNPGDLPNGGDPWNG